MSSTLFPALWRACLYSKEVVLWSLQPFSREDSGEGKSQTGGDGYGVLLEGLVQASLDETPNFCARNTSL